MLLFVLVFFCIVFCMWEIIEVLFLFFDLLFCLGLCDICNGYELYNSGMIVYLLFDDWEWLCFFIGCFEWWGFFLCCFLIFFCVWWWCLVRELLFWVYLKCVVCGLLFMDVLFLILLLLVVCVLVFFCLFVRVFGLIFDLVWVREGLGLSFCGVLWFELELECVSEFKDFVFFLEGVCLWWIDVVLIFCLVIGMRFDWGIKLCEVFVLVLEYGVILWLCVWCMGSDWWEGFW